MSGPICTFLILLARIGPNDATNFNFFRMVHNLLFSPSTGPFILQLSKCDKVQNVLYNLFDQYR